ncbi:hypothetical protein [Pseudotamlana carrageenivorans]|uniref:PKD domain-containing protein n=1 Tax=Pseudotamlana carrageenivorans TaxID=2069432 RepID=A0A2I7SEN9_9FLAO|nr:hypothetical protein [Tamlana carrageenivorans]AUS04356.1 hypothetical protein C1A40_02210 [Tamlana carrageenivorans]
MKNIKNLLVSFFVFGVAFLMTSCEPENHALGKTLDKSDIKYSIEQDFTVDPGGNTVIMTNETKGVTLTWDYETGRSNKATEVVKYAFKGDYTIKITAVTPGGLVELDPVTITVTDDNLSYVDDPLWNLLSGGVGESKTWVLDLDANGVSKYFNGPMYFYGVDNAWLESGGPWDGGDTGCYGDDCWNWSPDWIGNEWIAAQGDYGTMTFSLDGGPFLTTDHLMIPSYGQESGTYFLDADAKILTTSGATILHTNENDACVDNWYTMKIFSITENTLQLGVLRKDSCDGAATLVFNYITKEYSDNWVPEDLPDPTPDIDLDGGTVDDLLTTTTTTSKTWYMSPDSPFDWTDLDGNLLNGWQTSADYEAAGWPGYTSADEATVINNKITFSNDGTISTIDSNGVQSDGTYVTESGTNIITFSNITPTFPIGSSWATATTTSLNQWKIVKTAKTAGVVTDIWFGKRDETGKNEYMVFHFVLDTGGAVTPSQPTGTELTFDNSKFVYGDLEGNGNLRLEFFNEFGTTFSDPPLNPNDVAITDRIEITFTLSGINLASGAVGNYTADYQYASAGWAFGYWGEGTKNSGDTNITGDGTYTVILTPGQDVSGAVVFVIDIFGLGADITDLTAVTATVDKIEMF